MDIPANQFKQALRMNKPLFGLWQGIADTTCAEIGAGAGFDWLLIDGEHAPFDIKSIMAHLQAIAAYQIPAIVRPAEASPTLIKQLLDIGAQTLLIPMVENGEQAKQLVSAVRYPPQGNRGLGTSMARAAKWNRVADYIHQANDNICLIVQVETASALTKLSEIVAIDGVDAVFIGPSDLSASMGYPGQAEHPKVVAAIEQALKTIIQAGKHAGVLAMSKELIENYIAQGASFIGIGVDTSLLVKATQQLASGYIK